MKEEYRKLLKKSIITLKDDSDKLFDIPNEFFLEDFLNKGSANKESKKTDQKRPIQYLPNLRTGITEISRSERRKLLRTGRVSSISKNKLEKGIVINTDIDKDTNSNNVLDSTPNNWGIKKMNIDKVTSEGASVKIAVIDSGIERWHPNFKNKIDFKKNTISFIPSDSSINDKTGHGTHCAGIIGGGTDPNGIRFGIANKAELYIIKVIDESGFSFKNWIIEGIEWAISQNCNIANISISSEVRKGQRSDKEYNEVIKLAKDNGLIVVAAIGNHSHRNSIGRTRKKLKPIGKPANSKNCIAVTAIDKEMKIYSSANAGINAGQNITYAAPGVNIYSSVPKDTHPKKYCNFSGTSMAAPFITGSLALIMDEYKVYDPITSLKLLDRKLGYRTRINSDYGKGMPDFNI